MHQKSLQVTVISIRKIFLLLAIFLILFDNDRAAGQCCSNGINLLSSYNPDFSAPVTGPKPPGFFSDNNYSPSPAIGNYSIIVSRNYGSCSSTPEYDHGSGNASGKYLWYDTKASSNISNPGIAWRPFDATKPLASQSLISVTPNTNYVFSAWVRDIARESGCLVVGAPLVGLRINGVDMAQVDLGIVPGACCPDWVLLCTSWNSGNNVTALLQIESRLGINFTDLGIDDVYFGAATAAFGVSLGNDTTLCSGQSLLLQPPAADSILWSDGSKGSSLNVTTAGLYWAEVFKNGCSGRDSINVSYAQPPANFSLGKDTSICTGKSIALYPNPKPAGGYTWQDNSTKDSLVVTTAGTYSLTVSNLCGAVTDAVTVTEVAPPTLALDPDITLCDAPDFLILPQTTGQGNYLWGDGSVGSSLTVVSSGLYAVSLTNTCGTGKDAMQVTFLNSPQLPFNNGRIDVCEDSVVTLDAKNPGMTYVWSTGSTEQILWVVTSGGYALTISNNGECAVTDYVAVEHHSCVIECNGFAPTAFSPNGDGKNDFFNPLFTCGVESFLLQVYNRWGEKVYETTNLTSGWDGLFKNTQMPVGAYVYFCKFTFKESQETKTLKGNVTLIR